MNKLEHLRNSRAYNTYIDVLGRIKEMKSVTTGLNKFKDPSDYWDEELDRIDYMMDASPLIINKLRQHTYHITGVWPFDYRQNQDNRRTALKRRLEGLKNAGGSDLVVPESKELGGFGFDIDGGLYNLDTVKYLEVLTALSNAGTLNNFRDNDKRRIVWEIGSGWGGFAYQFKTLFPKVTYMLTDLPEVYLFSATYLLTLFPDARALFCTEKNLDELNNYANYDFIFISNSLFENIKGITPDLTINMVSFQEMTTEQVSNYVNTAHKLKCPLLYSFNRDCSQYNPQLTNIREIISGLYDVNEVSVLPSEYTRALKDVNKDAPATSPLKFRHVIGLLNQNDPRKEVLKKQSEISAPVKAVSESMPIEIGLGLPAYNGEKFIRQALDSILGQTLKEFKLIIVDDCSTDNTGNICKKYADRDERVIYYRNQERLGLIGNWRRAFKLSLDHNPEMKYFAWVSNNDIWDPSWLKTLYKTLGKDQECVLACPSVQLISENGDIVEGGGSESSIFDTRKITNDLKRFIFTASTLRGAGNRIYGLFRVDELNKTDILPRTLLPDMYTLFELSLYGTFRQSKKILFYRRAGEKGPDSSVKMEFLKKQKKNLGGSFKTWHFRIPWWFAYFIIFFRKYFIYNSCKKINFGRGTCLHLSLSFLAATFRRYQSKIRTARYKRLKRIKRPLFKSFRKLFRTLKKKVIKSLFKLRRKCLKLTRNVTYLVYKTSKKKLKYARKLYMYPVKKLRGKHSISKDPMTGNNVKIRGNTDINIRNKK